MGGILKAQSIKASFVIHCHKNSRLSEPMKYSSIPRAEIPNPLTVIHKAPVSSHPGVFHFQDAVIQADLDFNITGWNNQAELLYGLPGAMGHRLFDLVNLEFVNGSFDIMRANLVADNYWNGEVIFSRHDGEKFHLFSCVNFILNEREEAVAIMIICHNITDLKKKEKELAAAESDRKQLEERLMQEEIQKRKLLNHATIVAQEQERNDISKELHDNVNQILMSAKLFMDVAQKNPEQSKEMLDKAVEYQMLALEEIRKLSKTLSTSLVKMVGLQESVDDIVMNMKQLQRLDVRFSFNSRVEDRLSNDQKLMLFRIIQEQTSNILKHAEASIVQILINENKGVVHLVISDNGKGFEVDQKAKGIGFINIYSRVDAYNGKINLISSPGNGCILELCFPVMQ